MVRSILQINAALVLLLGANYCTATALTVPPFVPGAAYTLVTGDTLEVDGTLTGCALTLSPNTIFTISSGGLVTYAGATAATTPGSGGALISIILKPRSVLNATTAINIGNTDQVSIDMQGNVTGNLVFTTPGTNVTSIYGGGVVNGNITGFSGTLNLDGVQPVQGTITGDAGLTSTLNLGFKQSTDFVLSNALNNVPNIFINNAVFTINSPINNLNTYFKNSGNVKLGALLTASAATGVIDNYGNFTIESTGNITVIPTFNNRAGSTLTVNKANSLNLNTVVNDGIMNVNAVINPTNFTNGANNAAILYLNANFTVTNNFVNGNNVSASSFFVINGLTITTPSLINKSGSSIWFTQNATITSAQTINNGNFIVNVGGVASGAVTFSGALDSQKGTLTIFSTLPTTTASPTAFANVINAGSPILFSKVTTNNIFANFAPALDVTGTHLSLNYTRVPLNQILSNDPNTLTTALESVATAATPTAQQTQLITLIQNNTFNDISPANNIKQFQNNLSRLMPMAVNKSVRELHRSGLRAVLVRIAELTSQRKFYSAGEVNVDVENNLWFRPFYSQTKQRQDADHGLMAYRNNIYGGSIGVDTKIFNRHLVGLAINMSKSHIVDQNQSIARTKNYQGIVYGKYNFESNVYVDWLGSIGLSNSSQNRNGLDGLLAYSKLAWTQYSLRTSLGYRMFSSSPWGIEPDVSLQYTFLNNDDYTETGPSVTNLTVHPKNNNYLVGGLGVRAYLCLSEGSEGFSASVFGRADYTIIGKQIESTVNFVNISSPSFTTKITPNRILYALGASTSLNAGNFKIEFVFNYDFAPKYRDQQYYVNFAYKF